jgi:hypothetical protein
VKTKFRSLPRRRPTIDLGGPRRPFTRPDEDESAGRHVETAWQMQDHAPALFLE